MKKNLLLSLTLFGSISYAIPGKNVFWSLIRPIYSIDSLAENKLHMWHEKNDTGEYFWAKHHITFDGYTSGYFRKTYPISNPTSKDRVSRALILIEKMGSGPVGLSLAAKDPYGGPTQHYHTFDPVDYDTLWQEQSMHKRFWWTIRYRRPYTHVASLGKWGTEIAIVSGGIYALHRLKKWYQNRTKQDKATDTQENSEN